MLQGCSLDNIGHWCASLDKSFLNCSSIFMFLKVLITQSSMLFKYKAINLGPYSANELLSSSKAEMSCNMSCVKAL